MASALANRARGAIVGSAVADAAGKKLVFRHFLANVIMKHLNCSWQLELSMIVTLWEETIDINEMLCLGIEVWCLNWTDSSQRSPSTGCMTSRNCGVFWMRIRTPSSERSQRIRSTGGRRASRAAMETRHLYCWSHCLNAQVDFLPHRTPTLSESLWSKNNDNSWHLWHFQWLKNRPISSTCVVDMGQTPALDPSWNKLLCTSNKAVTNQVLKFKAFIWLCVSICDYTVCLWCCSYCFVCQPWLTSFIRPGRRWSEGAHNKVLWPWNRVRHAS